MLISFQIMLVFLLCCMSTCHAQDAVQIDAPFMDPSYVSIESGNIVTLRLWGPVARNNATKSWLRLSVRHADNVWSEFEDEFTKIVDSLEQCSGGQCVRIPENQFLPGRNQNRGVVLTDVSYLDQVVVRIAKYGGTPRSWQLVLRLITPHTSLDTALEMKFDLRQKTASAHFDVVPWGGSFAHIAGKFYKGEFIMVRGPGSFSTFYSLEFHICHAGTPPWCRSAQIGSMVSNSGFLDGGNGLGYFVVSEDVDDSNARLFVQGTDR
jgi:hypothetical protein